MKRKFKITEIHELARWIFISFVSSYIDMLNFINDEEKKVNPRATDCQTLFDNSMFISLLLEIGEEDATKIIKDECAYLKDNFQELSTGFGNPVTEEEYKSFIDDLEDFFINHFIDDIVSTFSDDDIDVDNYINDFSYKGSPVALISNEFKVDPKVESKLLEEPLDLDELSLRNMKDLAMSAYNIITSIDDECISVEIEDKYLEDDED